MANQNISLKHNNNVHEHGRHPFNGDCSTTGSDEHLRNPWIIDFTTVAAVDAPKSVVAYTHGNNSLCVQMPVHHFERSQPPPITPQHLAKSLSKTPLRPSQQDASDSIPPSHLIRKTLPPRSVPSSSVPRSFSSPLTSVLPGARHSSALPFLDNPVPANPGSSRRLGIATE